MIIIIVTLWHLELFKGKIIFVEDPPKIDSHVSGDLEEGAVILITEVTEEVNLTNLSDITDIFASVPVQVSTVSIE